MNPLTSFPSSIWHRSRRYSRGVKQHHMHKSPSPSSSTRNGPPSPSIIISALITSHSSLHSALKEFFEPLRTSDPRADFFTIYRKESDEFDREYAKKYDEDLNTSLIFVSFSPPSVASWVSSPMFGTSRLVCSQRSAQPS